MDVSVVGLVIVAAGFVVAVAGTALTTRTTRRATSESDEGIRTDLAVAVAVVGVVAMLFGAAFLAYILLVRG